MGGTLPRTEHTLGSVPLILGPFRDLQSYLFLLLVLVLFLMAKSTYSEIKQGKQESKQPCSHVLPVSYVINKYTYAGITTLIGQGGRDGAAGMGWGQSPGPTSPRGGGVRLSNHQDQA